MRKKILGFAFAAAFLVTMAVPVFGGGGTALAEPAHRVLVEHTRGNSGTTIEICIAEDAAADHVIDHGDIIISHNCQ